MNDFSVSRHCIIANIQGLLHFSYRSTGAETSTLHIHQLCLDMIHTPFTPRSIIVHRRSPHDSILRTVRLRITLNVSRIFRRKLNDSPHLHLLVRWLMSITVAINLVNLRHISFGKWLATCHRLCSILIYRVWFLLLGLLLIRRIFWLFNTNGRFSLFIIAFQFFFIKL